MLWQCVFFRRSLPIKLGCWTRIASAAAEIVNFTVDVNSAMVRKCVRWRMARPLGNILPLNRACERLVQIDAPQ